MEDGGWRKSRGAPALVGINAMISGCKDHKEMQQIN
jgi:hypothetical protein